MIWCEIGLGLSYENRESNGTGMLGWSRLLGWSREGNVVVSVVSFVSVRS